MPTVQQEQHPLLKELSKRVSEECQLVPAEHHHTERVERDFEEQIAAWEKLPKKERTREAWDRVAFKTIARKCNGALLHTRGPFVQIDRDHEHCGWRIVAYSRFRCLAAGNYGFDPDVTQYSSALVTDLELR